MHLTHSIVASGNVRTLCGADVPHVGAVNVHGGFLAFWKLCDGCKAAYVERRLQPDKLVTHEGDGFHEVGPRW